MIVREVSAGGLIVYLQPLQGVTVRYYLIKHNDRWLIDYRDQSIDHVSFRKLAL